MSGSPAGFWRNCATEALLALLNEVLLYSGSYRAFYIINWIYRKFTDGCVRSAQSQRPVHPCTLRLTV